MSRRAPSAGNGVGPRESEATKGAGQRSAAWRVCLMIEIEIVDEKLQQIQLVWCALCRARLNSLEYKLLIKKIRELADEYQAKQNRAASRLEVVKAARRVA